MTFVSNVKVGIELYRDEHGHFPSEWSDLDPYFDGTVSDVGAYIQGTDRYQLLAPPVPFSEPFIGMLIAVSRRSFSDVYHDYTWYGSIGPEIGPHEFRAIVLTPDDKLLQKTFSDTEMERLVRSADTLKIVPDSLPERSHVTSVRRRIFFGRLFAVVLLGLFSLSAYRFITRRRRHNKPEQPSPTTLRVDEPI